MNKKLITFIACLCVCLTVNLICAGYSGNFLLSEGSVYDGGSDDTAYGIAVDTFTAGGPYVYVVGRSSNGSAGFDYLTVKYNSSGIMVSSAVFNSGGTDSAYGACVDGSGNVYVTGISLSGAATGYVTIKYNSNLVFQSSAVYTTDINQSAKSIAHDSSENIYVAGSTGVVKYDSSMAYKAFGTFVFKGESVAVGNNTDVYVAGSVDGSPGKYVVARYDFNLVLKSSAVFSNFGSNAGWCYGVAVDSMDNVFVTGYMNDGTSDNIVTLKYNSALVFVSSAVFDTTRADRGNGVTVDGAGNIYVCGYSNNGTDEDFVVIKYSPAVVFLSSVTYNGGYSDVCSGLDIDESGNIYAAGYSKNSSNNYDYRTKKYTSSSFNSAPILSWTGETNYASDGLDPETGVSTAVYTYRVKYTDADNDAPASGYPKLYIKKSGVDISSSPFVMYAADSEDTTYSDGKIYVSSVSMLVVGATDYTYYFEAKDINNLSAIGEATAVKNGPHIFNTTIIEVSTDTAKEITVTMPYGDVKLEIPVGAFSESVSISISSITPPAADRATLKVTGIGLEISNDKNLQPKKALTITVNYGNSDIAGYDETQFVLARYNDTGKLWAALPSIRYIDMKKIIASTTHLSKFAVAQLVAASDISAVKVYPNPFRPKLLNQGMVIDNLTETASLKIYSIDGSLIKTVDYTDKSGKAVWDGKNESGKEVASGVYILYIDSAAGVKKIKIAVER